MPQRLEADDIINGNNLKLEQLDASLKQSLSISSPIVSSAHHSGFYVNGKCSVPIVEKARRVYVPKELANRPLTASNLKGGTKHKKNPSSPTNQQQQQQQLQQNYQEEDQQKSHLQPQFNEEDFSPLILDGYEKFADNSKNNNNIELLSLENLNLAGDDDTLPQKQNIFDKLSQSRNNNNNNNNVNNNNNNSKENSSGSKGVYKLSEGLQNSQIIQSYDLLFP